MAALPIPTFSVLPSVEPLEQRFQRLADDWLTETSHISSASDQVAHPAFQKIVDMGELVVPLILREMEKQSGHWHRVLKQITHADPVSPTDRGDFEKITKEWVRWGKEQGYCLMADGLANWAFEKT